MGFSLGFRGFPFEGLLSGFLPVREGLGLSCKGWLSGFLEGIYVGFRVYKFFNTGLLSGFLLGIHDIGWPLAFAA